MRKRFEWKRIMACLLTLSVMISCIGVNAAQIYTQQDLDGFNENVRLLSAFGLIDEGREAATTIKRGDFAAVMMKYLGYGEVFSTGNTFTDVPDRTSPIYSISQMGLMNGYGDGTFRPNDNISVEQAVTVIVKALGYEQMAQMKGGYPTGYYSCASQVDLFNKTSMQPEDTLTYFNLVQMLVNSLTAELVETDMRGGFSISDETWLSTRLDCEKRKGVVTAAQGVALNESGSSGNNTITIDGEVYEIEGDYSYLIGCYTEYYVNSDGKIIYIVEKRTDRQEFLAEDIIGYEGKTYTVESENNKGKKYRLSQDNYIIFNGTAADNITEEDMCPKYGKVTLVDNDNDNRYDVVMIESFDVYVVQSINQTDKKIYHKNAYGNALEFEQIDDDDLKVVNSEGKRLEFEQIPSDSVIRVAFDKDKKKAKIIVSTDTVKGTVTRTSKEGTYAVVDIDNIPHKVIDERVDLSTLSAGKNGVFYLDSEGMIADFVNSENVYSYGYLMGAYIEEDGETLGLTIFDSQGTKQYLNALDKITIDGLKRQKPEQVISLLKKGNDSVQKTVIRYKCNNEGKVKEIDTPYNSAQNMNALPQNGESMDSLKLIYSGSGRYFEQTHNFAGKLNLDNNSILFSIVGDNTEDYKIRKMSEIPDDTTFNVQAYSDGENEFYAKALFSDDRVVRFGKEVIGVISDVLLGLNEDDEPATIIKFHSKYYSKELCMETELAYPFPYNSAQEPTYEVSVGDIVTLKVDGNTAREVTMVYKNDEGLFPSGPKYANLGDGGIHYIYGSVYSLEKGFINITQKDIEMKGAPSIQEVESVPASSFTKVLKCTGTGRRKEVVQATTADIIDYKTAGNACSKVFISMDWQYPNIMIIYEE
ncbi:S-layer homology domain-containing protein [Lachnospiraceae bacterium MD329]|nr:S-layer homology domain-containing protein [Lachnospiraceae bacterium MD329]